MSDDKNIKKRKNALGRGLGALLHDSTSSRSGDEHDRTVADIGAVSTMREISIEAIEANPFQPRKDFDEESLEELAESIRSQGLIQPVTVRQLNSHQYQLIAGERRWRASQRAGLTTLPAYVRTADDQQMLEMALIENIQRENLNAIEIALSYQRLITECQLKQEELGERVGKKRSTVNNYIRLLRLPPQIQAGIRDEHISMGHARALINIETVDTQLDIYNRILEEELSVRRVEEIVRDLGRPTPLHRKDKMPAAPPAELKHLQTRLTSHFGTKVLIKTNDRHTRGEIKISFLSEDDLGRILELLKL